MSDLDVAPVDETPEAPPPVEGEAPPPHAPEPEEKEPSDEALTKAFTALNRKKKAHQEKLAALQSEKSALQQEREAFKAERAILERLRSGDEDALREAMGEDYFDRLVEKRLNPEATAKEAKLKSELQRRDEELQALKKRLDDFDRQQREITTQREEKGLLGYLRGLDAPELDTLEDDEALDIVRRLAPQFQEEAGRPPTFGELGKLLINMQRPKVERLKKRLLPAPPAAPPPGKKGAGGLTNRDSSTPAGATPEEAEDMDAFRKRMERKLLESLG